MFSKEKFVFGNDIYVHPTVLDGKDVFMLLAAQRDFWSVPILCARLVAMFVNSE